MKKNIIQITFALFVIILFASCHNHKDILPLSSVNIQFDSIQLVMREDTPQQIIRLTLDKPAIQDGSVRLSLNNPNPSRFIFEPSLVNGQINLNLSKNQQSATIILKPVNNSETDGTVQFDLMISATTGGLKIGERKTVSVLLIDDDSSVTPSSKVNADFLPSDSKINEPETQGKSFTIQLSKNLTSSGSIEISNESLKAEYGIHYITQPISVNGKMTLTPLIGSNKVDFTVIPVNNSIITGEMEINFNIIATTGAIDKGTALSQKVILADDELTNRPKGYVIGSGLWSLKKLYEYNEAGRVKYLHIEKSTPATSAHTETYFYDQAGLLQKINSYPQIDIVFTWANNRISKSENIDHGVIKEYTEYDYDAQGNVSGAANYFRQPDGQFKLGFLNIYHYYLDNNLYKSQTYIPKNGTDQLTLISTRTYDGYMEKQNPFPMVEILPTVKTQNKLPTIFIIEENGMILNYSLSYEFRTDGLVTKRTTSNGSTVETSNYLYY